MTDLLTKEEREEVEVWVAATLNLRFCSTLSTHYK